MIDPTSCVITSQHNSGCQSFWAWQQEEISCIENLAASQKICCICAGRIWLVKNHPRCNTFYSCTLEHFLPVFACKRPILQLFSGSSKKKKLLCLFAYQRYIVGGACTSSASNHSITSGDVAHHETFMQKSTSTSYCRFVGCGCMKINKLMEEDNLLKLCSLKGCASLVHSGCWQKFVVSELKKPTMVTEVVCSVSHLKQLEKQI